jgi:hypothetical protein
MSEWGSIGMDAMGFSTDMSHVGWWANSARGQLRSLIAFPCMTLIALWATSPVNMFFPAGIGEPMGICIKRAMEHNAQNKIYERPSQEWDDSTLWGRTQMEFHGDPTLCLFQVAPPSNAAVTVSGTGVGITWTASPEPTLAGYHVYRSAKHFGTYVKLTGDAPITTTSFTDNSPIGNAWYTIRAVKLQTTGSGTFLNPSAGAFCSNTTTGTLTSSVRALEGSVRVSYLTGGRVRLDLPRGHYAESLTLVSPQGRSIAVFQGRRANANSQGVVTLPSGMAAGTSIGVVCLNGGDRRLTKISLTH